MSKTAIVTGGSRGIGFATANKLASQGYNVLITAKTLHSLEKAAERIKKNNPTAEIKYKACDISEIEEVRNLFSYAEEIFTKADILVNAAAIVHNQEFISLNINDWQELMDINVRGTVVCCHEAFKAMRDKGGAIINLSSLGGVSNFTKFPGFSSYVTSKFAITGLTESLAVEGKPYKIRVNAIAPGAVDTDMLKQAAPGLKTTTKPDDIAETICYLCDPSKSGHINGTVLTINTNE